MGTKLRDSIRAFGTLLLATLLLATRCSRHSCEVIVPLLRVPDNSDKPGKAPRSRVKRPLVRAVVGAFLAINCQESARETRVEKANSGAIIPIG